MVQAEKGGARLAKAVRTAGPAASQSSSDQSMTDRAGTWRKTAETAMRPHAIPPQQALAQASQSPAPD
jgi:hypothetical protein